MRIDFDLSDCDAQSDLLDEGDYVLLIQKALVIPTKNDGTMISLVMKVAEGPDAGKTVIDNLNIINQSSQCERIARKSLKQIMECIKHPNPSYLADTEELVGGVFVGHLVITEKESKGNLYKNNSLKKILPYTKVDEGIAAYD